MNPLLAIKAVVASRFMKSSFSLLPAVLQFSLKYYRGYSPIYLDYPIAALPRYDWGAMPHASLYSLINSNRNAYAALIGAFASHESGLQLIPEEEPDDASSPYWSNGWVMGIDAVSLYVLPSLFKPNLYVEIGSGNSTKFVRRCINDNRLKTKIISIDPQPRAEIDLLCDEVIRLPVENLDITLFDQLQSGDILMVDNSHRCFQNSDVTVVFLDIFPRLQSGVIIYIDDVYLPYDYPPEWSTRYYSEQYLLAVMLLADADRRYEILLPAWFVSKDSALQKVVEECWTKIGLETRVGFGGNGFWIRVK